MKEPLGYKIHEINKLFKNRIKSEANKIGINSTYMFIFHFLAKNKDLDITQSDIADNVCLKAPTVSLTLQNMEQEGLLIREKSLSDCRKTFVRLTDKGIEMDNKLKEIHEKLENEMKEVLKDNLYLFIESLDKIKNVIKED